MNILWIFAAIACAWGAIAGAFLEPNSQYTAVAFGFLAVIFALAAYRGLSSKS